MTLKNHIPNLLTLLNLLAGTIAAIYAAQNDLIMAVLFVFVGIVFDFFDGFAARLLKIQGELGKQLDSLADVVTSGVVPGIVLFQLLQEDEAMLQINKVALTWDSNTFSIVPYFGLVFTLAAAYRLATFNIDERQSDTFIGLPAPAAALVVLSLPLMTIYGSYPDLTALMTSEWFVLSLTLVLAVLMNVNVPMFSLKFIDFTWQSNRIKYIFLLLALALIVLLTYYAIPLIILIYVGISIVKKVIGKG